MRFGQYQAAFQIRFSFLPILRDEMRSRIPGLSRMLKPGQHVEPDTVAWATASKYGDEIETSASRIP